MRWVAPYLVLQVLFAITAVSAGQAPATPAIATKTERELLADARAMTPAEAGRLEGLAANGDPEAHVRLSVYYFVTGQRDLRAAHVLWLCENWPSLELLSHAAFQVTSQDTPVNDPRAFPKARHLWDIAVARFPTCAAVLFNAAVFFQGTDPERAERLVLLGRRFERQSDRWTVLLASLYAKALVSEGQVRFAARSREVLAASKDPALLGSTGRALIPSDPESAAGVSPELVEFGRQLLARAHALDPKNPRWALASAGSPAPAVTPAADKASSAQPGPLSLKAK